MEAMLALIPKEEFSLDDYAENSHKRVQKITDLGNKFVLAYCKEDTACVMSLNDKIAR